MDYIKWINEPNEFEDLPLKDIEFLAKRMLHICNFTKLTPDELHWLFSCMCVKDDNGKWHELVYGTNYSVKFDYNTLIIIPSKNLHCNNSSEITPFKDEYKVSDNNIEFPKYTGYNKFLNGESEDLSKYINKEVKYDW